MAQQFHLHAGIFRIQRLDIKLLGTDDLYILFIHEFFL